jgi:hypothetical protein
MCSLYTKKTSSNNLLQQVCLVLLWCIRPMHVWRCSWKASKDMAVIYYRVLLYSLHYNFLKSFFFFSKFMLVWIEFWFLFFLRGFFLKVCFKVSSFAFEIPNHIKDHETPRRCQFDLKFCYDLYFLYVWTWILTFCIGVYFEMWTICVHVFMCGILSISIRLGVHILLHFGWQIILDPLLTHLRALPIWILVR